MKVVNLARRPFQNLRPLWRLTTLLWVVGGLFLILNLWLYWDHLTGFSETRGQLDELRASIESELVVLDDLERQIAALELDEQNETVEILNRLIAQRTFPWGLLFERLESVLPNDLRLDSVQPEGQELEAPRRTARSRSSRSARRENPDDEKVELSLNGTARSDEVVNELIDAMFTDPTFHNPTLRNERRNDRGEIDFSLSVEFLTQRAQQLARPETGEEEIAGTPPPLSSPSPSLSPPSPSLSPPSPSPPAAEVGVMPDPVAVGASATARLSFGGSR